jgi:serine/threonine protein kinase
LQANNPFVVRFYYSFSSPEKLFLVMEYCPGGDLSSVLQHLGRFDEHVARQYIAETVLALEYCHSKVSCCTAQVVTCHLYCSTWGALMSMWPGSTSLKLYWHWSTATVR